MNPLITKNKLKKRSQAEILGLAIVFVLIGVGLLFYIKYSASQKEDTKQAFVESNTASNMINSLLKTTTMCKDATVNDLIQDCAYAKAIICVSFYTELDSSSTITSPSCSYLSDFITNVFDKTFKEWSLDYYLSISNEVKGELITPVGAVCSGEKEAETSYIPTRAGTYTVELSICK